ncbi:MAG TPA: hypothetical protein VHO46_05660 [Bacteroidales bacterium]|nr:hypothetical protein [Bacteroidales bacterium]
MVRYRTKNGIEPIQPLCRKTAYHTPEEADDMIRYITETRVTKSIHSYKCPVCGFWHLTSGTHKK